MKDAIGQTINVGDVLVYGTTSRYPEFMTCVVVRLTPKTVVADKLNSSRPSCGHARIRICDTSHCVVMRKADALSKGEDR